MLVPGGRLGAEAALGPGATRGGTEVTRRRGVPRCGAAPRAQLNPVGFWRRRWVPAHRPGSVRSSGAALRTPSRCPSCSVLGSHGSGAGTSAPLRAALPHPRAALFSIPSERHRRGRKTLPPPPRSPLSRTVLRCARPHCAVPAAAVRERRSERRGRPPPLPPHQHRVGARRNGVNAPCSALAADRHLAPRSQICRASISPPSADLRLGSVVLPCWFFFSLPTVHLHHRGGKTFGEGWL